MSPVGSDRNKVDEIELTITIQKDACGYGMKVSGDKPVFVESVKTGGAAHKAGLMERDMIIKVNGEEAKTLNHTRVVHLIKDKSPVILTVSRVQNKMQRSPSISVGTPLSQRVGITAPQPVDPNMRREVEFTRISTLRLMLDQEMKNLENLKTSNSPNRTEILQAESNIKRLNEQLRQLHGEALGLSAHQINQMSNTSPNRRTVSSPEQHVQSRDSDNFDDETTPPGTPPPPYKIKQSKSTPQHMSDSKHMRLHPSFNERTNSGSHVLGEHDEFMPNDSLFNASTTSAGSFAGANISSVNSLQRQIISMEDDEFADDQDSISDDHGPFKSLQQLLEPENTSYLAVFLNFVLSNSNPSQLLFYLITGLYKDGTVKDMRKWAYEIHSTFLVPRAPLMWEGVDESLARAVDDVLQNEHDKGEILRKIFCKSRHRAKECIQKQLNEFQAKRIAGLGTMFGPSDQQLAEAKGDKVKEQRIVEETLMPRIQQLTDDLDKDASNECPKKSALSSALSTVLHRIFVVTRSTPGGPTERVHHFVSREKSFKSRLIGKNRKIMVRGHHLVLKQYYEVAHCNHCQNIIWGVSPQGYHCTNCELNIHRACSKILEENCPGPVPTKNDKMSKFIEKIRPAHYFNPAERSRRQEDDVGSEDLLQIDRPSQASVQRQPSDRRTDVLNTTTQSNHLNPHEISASHSIDNNDSSLQDDGVDNRDSAKSKSAPVSVNRSESYKERVSHTRNNRKNRRKTSDPSLTSKSNDDHHVELGIHNANFTASSSSSLSSSLGSPSTSLEAVGTPHGQQTPTPHQTHSNFTQLHAPRQWVDSEDEDEADWSSHVSADILHTLSDTEKRRQEIINEIYQTERNHVRTLRLLEGIFMRPLQESGALTNEHFSLLFPSSLLVLKDLHSTFEQQLKQRRIDHGQLVGGIGDLLLSMFDGSAGDQLLEHAAQFCARQKIALEALKENRRKDESLQRLLTKAESHKACRRLQLKDLLPTVLQRLTKYPLLFDSLAKITIKSPDTLATSQADRIPVCTEKEIQAIQRAREMSRRILDHVNQAVREAEDAHTLQTIQKRLDKSMYEKEPNNEHKHLDLTQHKLIYEGPLIHKKQPREQLHGLLFETMVVLLHKQDDKYILKYLVSPGSAAGESKNEIRFNPITKINLILVRQSAVEKNSFYLINTNVTQMLELTAPSALECKTWFNHISAAAEIYKQRTKTNHDMTPVEDSASVTAKESTESEFVANNTTMSGSSSNAVVENVQTPLNVADNEANDRDGDHNGLNGNATGKSSEDDVIDNKSHKYVPGQYSNNANNTRTLTQQSSLVAPSEVHISISPALTAQPVLTPNEQLRRLDESIRITLVEKQKIVCDIFKVPNEHFSAIADIVGQPEAPKEPSDIILAAFAQVQSLTGILNDHIKLPQIEPNEMLVKSASLCDDCFKTAEKHLHEHRQQMKAKMQQQQQQQQQQQKKHSTSLICQSSSTSTTVINNNSSSDGLIESINNSVPDDDGYCQIDEIRLPAIIKPAPPIPSNIVSDPRRQSAPAPLPPPSDDDDVNDNTQTQSTTPDNLNSDATSTTESNTNDISTNKSNDEYIEVNSAYDSIGQPLTKLDLNDERNSGKTCCDNPIYGNEITADVREYSIPTIPCHLISSYISALNLHISQLLPKLNERDVEREKLRKENQLLRDRLNSMHEREQHT